MDFISPRPWQLAAIQEERKCFYDKHFQIVGHPRCENIWPPNVFPPEEAIRRMETFVYRDFRIHDRHMTNDSNLVTKSFVNDFKDFKILVLTIRAQITSQRNVTLRHIEICSSDKMLVVYGHGITTFLKLCPSLFLRQDLIVISRASRHTISMLRSHGVFLPGLLDVDALTFFNQNTGNEAETLLDLQLQTIYYNQLPQLVLLGDVTVVPTSEERVAAVHNAHETLRMWRNVATMPSYREAALKAYKYMAPMLAEDKFADRPTPLDFTFDTEYEKMQSDHSERLEVPSYVLPMAKAIWQMRNIIAARSGLAGAQVLQMMETVNLARLAIDKVCSRDAMMMTLCKDARPIVSKSAVFIVKAAFEGEQAVTEVRHHICRKCGQVGHFEAICL